MQYALLGWPADGPRLRLDYRRFAYAGKFVTTRTGKAAVWTDPDPVAGDVPSDAVPSPPETGEGYADVLGAASFDPDRTEPSVLRVRYVTVREDRRGERLGARLLAFVVAAAGRRGFDSVRIAVNNPFAYEAAARAGFAWTGEETGLAELSLETPAGDAAVAPGRSIDAERYRAGLDAFRERVESDPEASFLRGRRGADPPAVVEPPAGVVPRDQRIEGDGAVGSDERGLGADEFGEGRFGGGSSEATGSGSEDATATDDASERPGEDASGTTVDDAPGEGS